MSKRKILLLGIDGMDPKIVNELMSQGKLENFKKLASDGSFLTLKTSYPPETPVAWTSIATGTNPGKHNLFDFIRMDRSNYLPKLSLTKSSNQFGKTKHESYVKTDSFWKIISEAGAQVNVIRWPVTFPPEKINGVMLSGLGAPDIKGMLAGYSFYTSKNIKDDPKSHKTIIGVDQQKNHIETEIHGPRAYRLGSVVEMKADMSIDILDNMSTLHINDEDYQIEVGKWSDWIEVKFEASFSNSVSGLVKAHLVGVEPFEMYLTSVQVDPKFPVVDISYPENFSSELANNIGPFYTLGMPEETDGLIDGRFDHQALLSQIKEIEEERDKMFWHLFEDFKNDESTTLAFVYDSLDRIQHVFWENKVLDGSTDFKISAEIEEYYVNKDKFLGELLSKQDDITVLIVSDHGITSFERTVEINTWLYKNKYINFEKNYNIVDESSLFEHVDWENSKAYSVGFASLSINQKGREKNGIVENSEEVMDEIIKGLESLVDPKTNKKPIKKVYKSSEIFTGDALENAPDMIIGFNPGYRMGWKSPIGGFTNEVFSDNTREWKGDHLVDPEFVPGVLFSNIKIPGKYAEQVDIAPTILNLLNLNIPDNMDGKSLVRKNYD